MPKDFLVSMRAELLVTLLIVVILLLKIGNKKRSNLFLLRLINTLLLINLVAGFFCVPAGGAIAGCRDRA